MLPYKSNTNGKKPNNAGNAKVFIAYTAAALYNGHIFLLAILLSFCLWFVSVFLFLSCPDLMGLLSIIHNL